MDNTESKEGRAIAPPYVAYKTFKNFQTSSNVVLAHIKQQ